MTIDDAVLTTTRDGDVLVATLDVPGAPVHVPRVDRAPEDAVRVPRGAARAHPRRRGDAAAAAARRAAAGARHDPHREERARAEGARRRPRRRPRAPGDPARGRGAAGA